MKLFRVCISLCCILTSFFSYGQNPETITFIRFNNYFGYVIDSAENLQCRCIIYKKELLSYGALVQLPDSSVVFRIKSSDKDGFQNIPAQKEFLDKIASQTPYVRSLSNEKDETKYLQVLAGDSATYYLKDYHDLKYKSKVIQQHPKYMVPKGSSFRYTYVNLGMGFTSREGFETFISWFGEIGTVRNRNIFSSRFWLNRSLYQYLYNDYYMPELNEKMMAVGLLYGRYFPLNNPGLSVNVGLSYCTGEFKSYRDESGEISLLSFSEVGIPVKVEMLLGKSRKYNSSLSFLAEFNRVNNYYGINFSFRISNEKRTRIL